MDLPRTVKKILLKGFSKIILTMVNYIHNNFLNNESMIPDPQGIILAEYTMHRDGIDWKNWCCLVQ